MLTPLAFDPGHPFPFISNLSRNFAVVVRHGGRIKFARVKVPDVLPRFVSLPESLGHGPHTFVFLEDVVRANIHELFPGTQVHGAHLFRIVRDADLAIEDDDADDLLESVDRSLRQLRRGPISLLKVEANMPARVLDILIENFGVERRRGGALHRASRLRRLAPAGARPSPRSEGPAVLARSLWRADEDPEVIFDLIRYQDLLVHHPFESFATVETFLRAAVRDRQVIAIKMTLYRIGADSPLIPLLIEAAEAGKQVAVLVELKARFDERNNIRWARRLESHGIHVVYGFASLKTHAKLCLVIRQEAAGVQRYVHTSTGNYNPVTAKVYTDLGLFTADPEVVADVSDIFNYLTGYSNQREYRRLVVAPMQLRTRIRELIRREAEHARAGRPARIIAKLNAVTDDQMIRELYAASQAGVEIDLIVRGICSLRPGIPGVSERIRVRSIVGRFLEHSRMFWFENGGHEELYLSSADLMERNLDRRVETMTPIRDRALLVAHPPGGARRLPARHRRGHDARLDGPLSPHRDRRGRRLQRAAGAAEALRRSARPVGLHAPSLGAASPVAPITELSPSEGVHVARQDGRSRAAHPPRSAAGAACVVHRRARTLHRDAPRTPRRCTHRYAEQHAVAARAAPALAPLVAVPAR